MITSTLQMYALIAFSVLSWLAFMLTLCKIYKFFNEFERFKSRNDAELNSTVWHLKRAEETRNEILIELRRTNKLLYDIYKEHLQARDSEIEYVDGDISRLEHLRQEAPSHPAQAEENGDALLAEDDTKTINRDNLLQQMQHQIK